MKSRRSIVMKCPKPGCGFKTVAPDRVGAKANIKRHINHKHRS